LTESGIIALERFAKDISNLSGPVISTEPDQDNRQSSITDIIYFAAVRQSRAYAVPGYENVDNVGNVPSAALSIRRRAMDERPSMHPQ
jgi:hypothetical protein